MGWRPFLFDRYWKYTSAVSSTDKRAFLARLGLKIIARYVKLQWQLRGKGVLPYSFVWC
jgi:hypothetical protein